MLPVTQVPAAGLLAPSFSSHHHIIAAACRITKLKHSLLTALTGSSSGKTCWSQRTWTSSTKV